MYGIQYTSAVTRNQLHTTCSTKQQADKEAKALIKEGAKHVTIYKIK